MNTNTILYFIAYLIIYSFAGWILESVYKSIIEKRFVNSGFLVGPFCPIYGFGALIMLISLNSLKEKPIELFIIAFFVLSLWEYIVGLFLEKVFKTKYWDYSQSKFNIQGRICLRNSIFWGILGVVFICVLHPFIDSYIKLIPTNFLIYIEAIVGAVIILDGITTISTTISFDGMVEKINELGETIKEKVKELNENKRERALQVEKESYESIENIIHDLKIKQSKLKLRIYKQANRLKNAFPTMKSESISKLLGQRIDLNKLKDTLRKKDKE